MGHTNEVIFTDNMNKSISIHEGMEPLIDLTFDRAYAGHHVIYINLASPTIGYAVSDTYSDSIYMQTWFGGVLEHESGHQYQGEHSTTGHGFAYGAQADFLKAVFPGIELWKRGAGDPSTPSSWMMQFLKDEYDVLRREEKRYNEADRELERKILAECASGARGCEKTSVDAKKPPDPKPKPPAPGSGQGPKHYDFDEYFSIMAGQREFAARQNAIFSNPMSLKRGVPHAQ